MKTVNCGNYFTEKRFNNLCEVLESEGAASVYIDCIGHTRNNSEQESYKKALEKKYGDRLSITCHEGVCSYHYDYELKLQGRNG